MKKHNPLARADGFLCDFDMISEALDESCGTHVPAVHSVCIAVGLAGAALIFACGAPLKAEESRDWVWSPSGEVDTALLLWESRDLETARERLRAGDPVLEAAYGVLIAEADRALDQRPVSVVDKERKPPSGDMRDYLTFGPYWWPDPDSEDGLPYVRRDGVTNPESSVDRAAWSRMQRAVTVLVPAWYFSGEERYAQHAAHLVRHWFLNEETGMNPHLTYAQGIPGRMEGRGIGTIDISPRIAELLSCMQLLEESLAWTRSDARALRAWMGRLLQWIGDHEHGSAAFNRHNNIGTWFDVLVSALALYSGAHEIAEVILESVPERRFADQIAGDGSLPHELGRKRSKGYVSMNVRGFLTLAILGERVSLDLWRAGESGDVFVRRTLDWLAPFALGEQSWEWEQVAPFDDARFAILFHIAGRAYDDAHYLEIARSIGEAYSAYQRLQLFFPVPR